jgi:hypothetical protein
LIPLLLLRCLAFGQPGKRSNDEILPAFVVVPGAVDVTHYDLEGGRKRLSYRLEVEYPAQNVLDTIQRQLKQRGWVPLPHDYFNPGLKSSVVRGWDYYEDHATQSTTSVRVWQADWRHKSELMTYRLEYRCPDAGCASTRNLHEVRIIAIYTAHPDKAYRR